MAPTGGGEDTHEGQGDTNLEEKLSQAALEAFQLQCIVDAKDREIAILRGQIGADAGAADRAEAAEQEVARLTAQISDLTAGSAPPPGAPPPPAPGVAVGAGGGGASGGRPVQREDAEVVALNVSGREAWALRSTLLSARGSRLAELFSPGAPRPPPRDVWGRPFLPYQPDAFAAVLEGLQGLQTLGLPPADTDWAAARGPREAGFRRLLQHLRLHHLFYEADGAAPAAPAAGGGAGGGGSGEGSGSERAA